MTERLWEVPSSWEWTVIKELGDIVSGATPSTKVRDHWDGDVIWFAPSDLTGYKQKFIARGAKTLTEEGLANSSARIMPAGSVMFSSRAPVGYVAINSVPAATNQGFKSVVPYTGIFNEYLYHYLKASKQMAEQRATGTTFKELSGAAFGALPAPLPPVNEQRRIVEKIEAMFDEIDAGIQSLQTARTTLGLYRQSLLKSAFEGRLTADWRAQNADKLEAPESLLVRIQRERDTRYKTALDTWQDALAAWRADGEKGKKPTKPKRLAALATTAAPFPIPANWFALSVGSLGRVETGATPPTKSKENFGGNVPFFKPTDLEAGAVVREAREFLSETGAEKSRPFSAGTILVTCIGATIGKTGLARVDAACNQQINYIEPDPNFEPRFVYYQIISPFFQDQIKDNASSTTLPILNKGKFSLLPTIICSPAEQAEIVRRLDTRLEAADALEAEIDAALTRADALRQSILKKAFSGQLVPQDPNDEPASALLERIKAEKAEREQAAKRDRKSAPARKPKARRPTLTDLIEVLEKQKSWISAAKAAQELGIGDGSTSDDVEAFYRQLKDFFEDGAIEVERRGDEDWLRRAKAEVS